MRFLLHTILIPELNVTLIPLAIFKIFDPEPYFFLVNLNLSTDNNSKVLTLGKCSLTPKHKKDHFDVSFIVVDSKSISILGLSTSECLNMIKRSYIVNVSGEQSLYEFSDCFGEIRTLKNTHHIEIKDNITLVVIPDRKTSLFLKPKLEKELKYIVDLVIEPVQKPTDWVSGTVLVEKPNGKLRVCVNPRPLSKTVKAGHLQLVPSSGY